MAGLLNRSQGKHLGDQRIAWQDRNTFLTEGGLWSWNQGTGLLSWSSIVRITRASLGPITIAAGNVTLGAAGSAAYVDLNRQTSSVGVPAVATLSDSGNANDDRMFFAFRGVDGNVYLSNGDILFDGDSKVLGTVNSSTQRAEVTATGNASITIPFSYAIGTGQLGVFVGGVFQTIGVDYVESTTASVTFQAGSIPSAGEQITFLNLIGGQGPKGTGVADLQEAYNASGAIVTTEVQPLGLSTAEGDDTTPILRAGSATDPDAFEVRRDGRVKASAGIEFVDPSSGNSWLLTVTTDRLIIYEQASGEAIGFEPGSGAIQFGNFDGSTLSNAGGLLKWAVYTGTFSSSGPTTIPTGIATGNIKGAILRAENQTEGHQQLFEFNLGATVAKAAYVSENAGTITISADTAGVNAVGTQLQARAYTLIVFYE